MASRHAKTDHSNPSCQRLVSTTERKLAGEMPRSLSARKNAGLIRASLTHTNAVNTFAILLGGHDDQRFAHRPTPDGTFLLSSQVGIVHLDHAVQLVAAWADHGPAQLVQHGPSRL